MMHYDVYNGDADGLCALQQLRLSEPLDSQLVTGVKRDIALLRHVVAAPGDRVTVLDIALDKNRSEVERLLGEGAHLRYFDHHYAGVIPEHPRFEACIDTAPDICTSLLVNRALAERQARWAVVGAFGDNLERAGQDLATRIGLGADVVEALNELGILLNYNGYGATLADLFIAPDALFRELQPFADPLDFAMSAPSVARLRDGYRDDMARAATLEPVIRTAHHALLLFPAEPWARRVSGVRVNALAQAAPERAHALLTRLADDAFLVSVRAPLARPRGAEALCRQFDSGGGRQAAAGINRLPAADYDRFVAAFLAAFHV